MTIYSWKAIETRNDDLAEFEAAFASLTTATVDDSAVVKALQASPWELMQQGQVSA